MKYDTIPRQKQLLCWRFMVTNQWESEPWKQYSMNAVLMKKHSLKFLTKSNSIYCFNSPLFLSISFYFFHFPLFPSTSSLLPSTFLHSHQSSPSPSVDQHFIHSFSSHFRWQITTVSYFLLLNQLRVQVFQKKSGPTIHQFVLG